MKYRILLLFSILNFGLFFPNTNNSALAQSNEDFATTVYKTREEISDLTQGIKNLLSDRKKLLLEMNTLTNDIDKVLLKFKNGQIKDCNNEIGNIAKRIKTVRDKGLDSEDRIDDFNKRKAAVDCQLDENPRLKDLVCTNDLYKAVNEFNTFDEEFVKKLKIYGAKRVSFENKVKTLPSVRKIQKEVVDLAKEWETLLQEANEHMTEMNVLTNDIETVIQKINNHQITDCNDEIKNIGSRTNTCYEKYIKIEDMRDSLREREDEIIKDPKKVLSFIDWTDYNKMIEEWNAFRDEFDTKWNNYKDKAKTFKSKIKTCPCIRRYQDEVDKITEDRKILVPDIEKWITEERDLIKDVDKVILKIDNHQITELNDEIKNIASRLYGSLVKGSEIENKINELKEMGNKIREGDPLLNRSNIVRINLSDASEREEDQLVDLIDWREYYKSLNALHIFYDVSNDKTFDNDTKEFKSLDDTFIDKLDVFKSKIKNFTAVRKLQNELADITNGWQTLLSDEKKFLSEADLLIKDIDRVIGKIDNREITNYNNEIKDVNNWISSVRNKSDDIDHRVDELNGRRKDKIFESEYLRILVDWTDYNKVLDEWNALIDKESNPKWDTLLNKIGILKSKVKNFPAMSKLQNEVIDITDGWKILLSDKKNLLSEMDPLIKDINRAMEKIDRREIKKYNKEIKGIYNRINSLNEKNDDISSRKDDLNHREDAVSETQGIGNLVDWTDFNKVIDKWNTFRDEEDIPKWDIFNKKVETFNSITANLSNHP